MTIKINVPQGASLKTNSTKTIMKGIEQNAQGGEIKHQAEESLIQEGNIMDASEEGTIINEVGENGSLKQTANIMKATNKGKIINRVNPKKIAGISSIIIIIGILADLATLINTGEHFWNLFKNL